MTRQVRCRQGKCKEMGDVKSKLAHHAQGNDLVNEIHYEMLKSQL